MAITLVGLPGGVGTGEGMTWLDESDSVPGPTALMAWMVKVYSTPLVRPLTEQLVALSIVQVTAPRPASVSVTV